MTVQALADSPIQNLLFEQIHPVLEQAINIRSVERQMINVEKRPVSGKYYRIDELIGGNFRYEGRPEGGYIPGFNPSANLQDTSASLQTLEMRFKRRLMYSSVQFTGPMDNAPKTSSGGYDKLSAIVMEQTTTAFPEMISSKLARGNLGIKGEVQSVLSNVVTLVPANAPATAATSRPWAGNRFFREGDVCDIVQNSAGSPNPLGALRTGASDKGRRVTAISRDGATSTVTFQDLTGTTLAAGDLLVTTGERQDTAISAQADYENGLYGGYGIMDAIQDGTDSLYSLGYYGNVQVSSQRLLQSFKITNTTNTALTVDMCNQLISQMFNDSLGGQDPDFIYCTMDVYRTFAKGFTTFASSGASTNLARWTNPGAGFTPTVGVSGIEVNNIGTTGAKKFMVSAFAPHYRAYFIRKDSLIILSDLPLGVMNNDGLTLRQVPGTDQWSVAYKAYESGVVCLKPSRNGYIVGLTGDHNNA